MLNSLLTVGKMAAPRKTLFASSMLVGLFITISLSSWALNWRICMCLKRSEPIQASSSDRESGEKEENDAVDKIQFRTASQWSSSENWIQLKNAITWKFPFSFRCSKIIANLQTLEQEICHERNVEKRFFIPLLRMGHQMIDVQVLSLLVVQLHLWPNKNNQQISTTTDQREVN